MGRSVGRSAGQAPLCGVQAVGEFLRAEGRVLRAGRTITVCHGDVYAVADGEQTHCATMIATMIRVDSTA